MLRHRILLKMDAACSSERWYLLTKLHGVRTHKTTILATLSTGYSILLEEEPLVHNLWPESQLIANLCAACQSVFIKYGLACVSIHLTGLERVTSILWQTNIKFTMDHVEELQLWPPAKQAL
jgi:hypothetical protein